MRRCCGRVGGRSRNRGRVYCCGRQVSCSHPHQPYHTPTTAATPMPTPADTMAAAAAICRMQVSVVLVKEVSDAD